MRAVLCLHALHDRLEFDLRSWGATRLCLAMLERHEDVQFFGANAVLGICGDERGGE
jgi:hypothetical protein